MDAAHSTGFSSWSSIFSNTIGRIMGFSLFASIFSSSTLASGTGGGYVLDSTRLLVLGTILEAGRRFFQWLVERFRLQYSITAQFTEGDPAFEWIVMYMTEKSIWKRSRDFRINAKSSIRRWGISIGDEGKVKGVDSSVHVDLVPTYELPHLFRWNGVWIETKRSTCVASGQSPFGGFAPGVIYLTMYTLDVQALQGFIEEARLCYVEHGRSSVILHTASQPNFGPGFVWNCVKRKLRRPINSIILEEGTMDSILSDAREFIEMENWYIDAGIPHRRGYLFYGPPGTGKSSTIHALAGELGLEIFSLSLSAGFVDDAFLQQAASSIPKKAIFLIEDIDCAFSTTPRLGDDLGGFGQGMGSAGSGADVGGGGPDVMAMPGLRRSSVTLSGLLNVIDGIGSEEGILFFATTNCIGRLDPALLRPGRIDRKVRYRLTTKAQAASLFDRFFPATHITLSDGQDGKDEAGRVLSSEETAMRLAGLGKDFSESIPDFEFSTAELQGYLLSCKRRPHDAASGAKAWVEQELQDRREKALGLKRARAVALGTLRPLLDPVSAETCQSSDPSVGAIAGEGGATASEALTPPHTPPLVPHSSIQFQRI